MVQNKMISSFFRQVSESARPNYRNLSYVNLPTTFSIILLWVVTFHETQVILCSIDTYFMWLCSIVIAIIKTTVWSKLLWVWQDRKSSQWALPEMRAQKWTFFVTFSKSNNAGEWTIFSTQLLRTNNLLFFSDTFGCCCCCSGGGRIIYH